MDRLAGIEAFVAIVEAGGFQAAAKQLGLSRALVSKRIAALERSLGTQLLHRTTRRLAVTAAGAEFYERAKRIRAEIDAAMAELAQHQAEPAGLVKINAPMSFGQLHLAPVLVEFMQAFPRVNLQLTLTDHFVDVVDEGYDLVLRIGALRDSSLIARRLTPVRRYLCASPAYLAEAGTPDTPQALRAHRLLHYGWLATGTRWQLVSASGEETVVEGPISLCVNNGDLLAAAASSGLGITLLPTFIIAPELRAGRLVRLLPGWEGAPIALSALWPSSRVLPLRVRTLIDFLVTRFSEEPPAWDSGVA